MYRPLNWGEEEKRDWKEKVLVILLHHGKMQIPIEGERDWNDDFQGSYRLCGQGGERRWGRPAKVHHHYHRNHHFRRWFANASYRLWALFILLPQNSRVGRRFPTGMVRLLHSHNLHMNYFYRFLFLSGTFRNVTWCLFSECGPGEKNAELHAKF